MYLSPVAVSYLTQIILAALISGYFLWLLRRQPRPRHLCYLTAFFITLTAFIFTLFWEAVLPPTPRLYAVFLQTPVLSLSWLFLIQFAYHFPELPPVLRREARLSLFASGLYTLWESAFAVFRFIQLRANVVEYRIDWTDYLLLCFLLWPSLIFARQLFSLTPAGNLWARLQVLLRRPSNRETRALSAFTLIFLFVAGLSLLNLLRTFYLLSVALANLGIALGILAAMFAFALAYINHRPGTTSFMIKLAGVTLTVMLAILGIVGWTVAPVYIASYQPNLHAARALRFMPNAGGGYDITGIPAAFDRDLGENLHLDDGQARGCSDPLAFPFPFYGQTYPQLYVCNDGAISLGQSLPYRDFQYRYGAGKPLLLPLLIDLDPTISSGGVFARQEQDHLILTWDRLRGFRQPEAEFTFQVILYADGVFDFVYAALPDQLTFLPNDEPGASLWAIGAVPGHANRSDPLPQLAALNIWANGTTENARDARVIHSGPEGILQDFNLEFRQHVHRLLAPLAGVILAASAFIVLGFPLMFYAILVNPLNALLQGVRRIETGDYDVCVPVQAHDEIGFLTRAFNKLSTELGDLIHNLEARVSARTEALHTANVHLRKEIKAREEAQETVLAQQRELVALETREKISRDLHDGLGQVINYIHVQAQAVQIFLEQGAIEIAQHNLADLLQATHKAHAKTRTNILNLRMSDEIAQDFLTMTQECVRQFGERWDIHTVLSLPQEVTSSARADPIFTPVVEEQATHILQEALSNVRKHARAQRVEVTLSFVKNQVQVLIADDGIGFELPSQPSDRATEHFGLEIMRERAERVSGTLEVRSAPGQGTRVLVTLPRLLPAKTSETASENDLSFEHLRMLLVDDHTLFLESLRNLLVARGLTVIGTAHDGCDALEKTRALQPNVVVMDLKMPRCDGIQATRAIKAEFPNIKIVILTAFEDDEHLFEAIKSGASAYVNKNMNAPAFCDMLLDTLQGNAPLAPDIAQRLLGEFTRVAHEVETVHHEEQPTDADTPPLENPDVLSAHQWEILGRVADGIPYKIIADEMHLTEQAIKYHMMRIVNLLHLENRTQAIGYYLQTQK